MQQSLSVVLLFLGIAAARSSSAEEKNGGSVVSEEEEHKARVPLESPWHQYLREDSMDDFTGDAFPGQSGRWFPRVENTSDPRSWRDAFMKVYAASYLHFAHASDSLPASPEDARDASNITDLKKWKARQEAAIKGFVPKEFQEVARRDAERRFEQRASEIKAEQRATTKQASSPAAALPAFLLVAAGGRPMKAEAEVEVENTERYAAQWLPHVSNPANPTAWKQAFMQEYAASYMELLDDDESVARMHSHAPAHAGDCRTTSELRAWRTAQEARIRAFVPEEFQKMAAGDVTRKFEKREAALADEAARQPQQRTQQGHKEGHSAEDKHSREIADSKSSTAGVKQEASNAGGKSENPTVLAASPASHIPLLAVACLLASLATGALVARCRVQRTLDMGSYLLVTEA